MTYAELVALAEKFEARSRNTDTKFETLLLQQRHIEWLLHAILMKGTIMVDTLDTFITDMTAKMDSMEAGVASLRPFIEDLFAKIGTIPGLTDAQKTALDGIEARVDTDAAKILASMGPPVPPAA